LDITLTSDWCKIHLTNVIKVFDCMHWSLKQSISQLHKACYKSAAINKLLFQSNSISAPENARLHLGRHREPDHGLLTPLRIAPDTDTQTSSRPITNNEYQSHDHIHIKTVRYDSCR